MTARARQMLVRDANEKDIRAEHAPEHVMDKAPLSHTDNLTVPLGHQQMRYRALAKVSGAQHLR